LRATAQRLKTLKTDLVARVGNDQFALAVAIGSEAEVAEVLERLTLALGARFALPGADLKVRFAIGFVAGAFGADAMTLVRQAGAALADSKANPLRRPCEFAAERETRAHQRLQMTAELQRALSSDEFIYHYQPQVDLSDGRIIGAEALIRWQHALFGLQTPARFVGLAEETGLILDVGASGLRKVASFAAEINRRRTAPLSFSFNVSPIELTHRDMVSLVRCVLDETGADPACLTLELTENLLAEDSPEMLGIFHRLRDLGIGLSIDDFGTGYSSLRYLERFPLTEIKIDRSFVSGLPHSAAKRVIVEAVIKLGSELGVRVVGEGVEQQTERDMLAAMGCTVAQGHLFSQPLPADEFRAFTA
jgi:EAL domain-containing protein (putative c-di-GMP-specific phosphodiesterase class I)